jgi:hypothetical protein
MPFKPGQSGNPGGRPKEADGLAKYIRSKSKDCFEFADILMEMARNGAEDKDKFNATKLLLEYGIGKPTEHVEHTVDESLAGILGSMMAPKAP